jgi:uncharacterized membrane protein
MTMKNMSRDKAKWLIDELPELKSKGVIDDSAMQALTDYYSARIKEKQTGHQYFLLTLAVLGTLLISGGVILLFAYNWDMLLKYERIIVAFIPLAIGTAVGVYTIIKIKGAGWCEFSAVFTAAGFAVLIALISQIYHTGGNFEEYMKIVLLLALPLIYIFESEMLLIAYCFGLFPLIDFHGGTSVLIRSAYLAGVVPYIGIRLFRRPFDGITVWMRYIVIIPALFFVFINDDADAWLIRMIIITATVFIGGLEYREKEIKGWKNPWLIAGWISFTALITIASISRHFWNMILFRGFNNEPALVLLHGIMILFFVILCIMAFNKWTYLKLMAALFPLLALLKYYGFVSYMPMFWIANVYLAGFGIMTLVLGMRNRDLIDMNAGMLQLVLLFSCKFFDENIDIMRRSIIFIVIGVLFILTNMYLSYYFKKSKAINLAEKNDG